MLSRLRALFAIAGFTRSDLISGSVSGAAALSVIVQLQGIVAEKWEYDGLLDRIVNGWRQFMVWLWQGFEGLVGLSFHPILYPVFTASLIFFLASEISVRRQRGEPLANLIFRLDQMEKSVSHRNTPVELYILAGIPMLIVLPIFMLQLAIGAVHRFGLGSESLLFLVIFPMLANLSMLFGYSLRKVRNPIFRTHFKAGLPVYTNHDLYFPYVAAFAAVAVFFCFCFIFSFTLDRHDYLGNFVPPTTLMLGVGTALPAFVVARSLIVNWRDTIFLASWVVGYLLTEVFWWFVSEMILRS